LRDRVVAHGYERFAALGSRLPRLVNSLGRNRAFRKVLELVAGIDGSRPLPRFRGGRLHDFLPEDVAFSRDRKVDVVYFADTYASLIDWQLGLEAVGLLRRFGYTVAVPELPGSGMPLVQYGFLDAARRRAERVVEALLPYVESGSTVVTTEPTAAYCLREVYPWLLNDERSRKVASSVSDLIAFLSKDLEGSLTKEGPFSGLRAYRHVPCHMRGTGEEEITSRLLEMVGIEVSSEDTGCCGMAGTWGLRSGVSRSQLSLEIGRRVAERVMGYSPQAIVTESSVCSLQLSQLTGLPVLHPVSVFTRVLESNG
jgi:glycerol-3-phosphate dehydrogenase subunit C